MNLHTDTPLMATADQRFRALVDLSPDAILIHAHGRFVYANQAAVTLLRAGSAQGYYCSPPLPPDAFVELWRRGLLAPRGWTRHPEPPAIV